MVKHSGQFKRVGGEKHVFPSFHEAADAVQVYLSEVPRGNCRAKAEGDKGGELAGSVRVHDDGRGGTVFTERTRECASWREDAGRKMSYAERRQWRIDSVVREAQKKERLERERKDAAYTASEIWRVSRPVVEHPYLTRKRIKPTSTMREADASIVDEILSGRGIRNDHGELYRTGLHGRLLVIPLQNKSSELQSLQFIDAKGKKQFMKTGRVGGLYWLSHPVEAYQSSTVIGIAEGMATALSVELVKGFPCVAAMSSGNLGNVARLWADRFRQGKRFLILSDVGNGEDDAREAAESIGALCFKPPITDEVVRRFRLQTGGDKPTDWNDFYIATGDLTNEG